MRSSDLRHPGEVEKLDGNTWSSYASAYFSIQTLGDSDGRRNHSLLTRWTPALAYLVGVSELNRGYRVLVRLGGEQHDLVIHSAVDPDNRQRTLQLLCSELLQGS